MIFAVFDVLLAVNMCINYSFFTFIEIETSRSVAVVSSKLSKLVVSYSHITSHKSKFGSNSRCTDNSSISSMPRRKSFTMFVTRCSRSFVRSSDERALFNVIHLRLEWNSRFSPINYMDVNLLSLGCRLE